MLLKPSVPKKQVDVVLPLKTRRPAAIIELITHAQILNTLYNNNVLNFVMLLDSEF